MHNNANNYIKREGPLKVLLTIVEKPEHSQQVVQALARETNYFVLIINDYNQALEIVEEIHPDLFILDYPLTGDNALIRYQQLRTNIVYKNTPVLILNTPQKKVMESEMLVCLARPIQQNTLLSAIHELLAKNEQVLEKKNIWGWSTEQCG